MTTDQQILPTDHKAQVLAYTAARAQAVDAIIDAYRNEGWRHVRERGSHEPGETFSVRFERGDRAHVARFTDHDEHDDPIVGDRFMVGRSLYVFNPFVTWKRNGNVL